MAEIGSNQTDGTTAARAGLRHRLAGALARFGRERSDSDAPPRPDAAGKAPAGEAAAPRITPYPAADQPGAAAPELAPATRGRTELQGPQAPMPGALPDPAPSRTERLAAVRLGAGPREGKQLSRRAEARLGNDPFVRRLGKLD